jgi:hypothetical protein
MNECATSTLSSMNTLAHTWKQPDGLADAIVLMEECVQLQSRILVVDHPSFQSSSGVLAATSLSEICGNFAINPQGRAAR